MNPRDIFFARRARLVALVAFASLAFTKSAFGADPIAASVSVETAAPKTHVLFMGANFLVEQNRKFYPVEDVTPGGIVIKPSSKPVKVSLEQSANLLINESLKIAADRVEISRLKFERAYAIGSDPFDQLARSSALAADTTALADIARGEAMRANMSVMTASGPDRAVAEAQRVQAEANFSKAIETPVSQIYDVGGQSVKTTGEEMFDAIRITFEVTPETDLEQSYLGVIARVRDRSSKPGQVQKWAYVEALGPIAAGTKKKVLVYRSGFPPGYILDGCDVHLYRGNEELATNLSRRRIELTDEEALEYRIIEYIEANKGKTTSAALATTTLRDDARRPLSTVHLKENYYVKVGKSGRVLAVFRDAAGKQPVQDSALEPALKSLRFRPALEAGKPVESITPLNLGQLN
jgi:hypothetical protein